MPKPYAARRLLMRLPPAAERTPRRQRARALHEEIDQGDDARAASNHCAALVGEQGRQQDPAATKESMAFAGRGAGAVVAWPGGCAAPGCYCS